MSWLTAVNITSAIARQTASGNPAGIPLPKDEKYNALRNQRTADRSRALSSTTARSKVATEGAPGALGRVRGTAMREATISSPAATRETVIQWHKSTAATAFGLPRGFILVVLVACAYYGGTKLGLLFTPPGQAISTLWPPNALVFAALLLTPVRTWPILLAAVLPVHMFVQLRSGIPELTAAGWYVTNMSEALLGAACLRAFSIHYRIVLPRLFESFRGVIAFLLLGVLFAPLVTSFLDAAVVVETGWGLSFWTLWRNRSLSNMLANLTLIPPLVVIGSNWRSMLANKRRYLEVGLVTAAIVLIAGIGFGTKGTAHCVPLLIYLLLPFLLWAAVRLGSGGVSASLLLIALLSIWNAMHDRGPFGLHATNVLSLQIFLSAISVPLLCLTATLAERRSGQDAVIGLTGKVIKAQDEERHRIARELHDDIGQRLTLLMIDLNRVQRGADSSVQESMLQLLNEAQSISECVRNMSHNLHPARIDLLPLGVVLRGMCREFTQRTPIEFRFEEHDVPARLPLEIKTCLYRVAQEAFQNIVKHSRAHRATVELARHGDHSRITLRVDDDGVGFAEHQQQAVNGLGMASMRERLASIGGTIEVTTAPNQGTRIVAYVPLPEASVCGLVA